MRTTPILLFMVILAFPSLVLAEIDTDLRFKLGSAAGSDRIEIGGIGGAIGNGSNHHGTNAQIEVVINRYRDSAARFIAGIGIFYRDHPGEIKNLSIPIQVEYAGIGMSIAPGLRIRISDIWNFEGKFEVGLGKTFALKLDSPGVIWNATKKDDYVSVSPILGCFYLFKSSASRIGLEVGFQKFWGDFKIQSNSGEWSHETVSGRNSTANIIYGIQF